MSNYGIDSLKPFTFYKKGITLFVHIHPKLGMLDYFSRARLEQ